MSRGLTLFCGAMLCLLALPSMAAPVAEADVRPALQISAFDQAVMQAICNTGQRLVAVGERGLVLLSDDEGATWRQARVPLSVTLTAVRFPTPQQGWAVGHFGTVLHSSDGGESWQVQLRGAQAAALVLAEVESRAGGDEGNAALAVELARAQRLVADGPDKPLLDLYFANEREGIVVGAYNLILRTRDGGQSWQSLSAALDNPGARHLYAIGGSAGHLYIAGEEGRVFRSDDQGATFTRLPTPYAGSFFTLASKDDELLVAGLRGNALRSMDRGVTWQRLELPSQASVVASLFDGTGRLLLANQAGQLVEVTAGNQGRLLLPTPRPPLTGLVLRQDGTPLASSLRGIVDMRP